GLFGSGDDEVQARLAHLVVGRVNQVASVHEPDANARDGVREGYVREVEGERRARYRQHVGVVLVVGRDDRGDDLRLVAIAFGEERAAGTVYHTRGQDFLLAGASLAPEVVAGYASGRVVVLAVLDREREEINAFARRARADRGDEEHRVAVSHDARAVRLLRDPADLDRQLALAQFYLLSQ